MLFVNFDETDSKSWFMIEQDRPASSSRGLHLPAVPNPDNGYVDKPIL